MQETKFVDIDKILTEKASALKKWLPLFLLNWLKRKLHEEDINKIMHTLRDCRELEFNTRGLEELGVKVEAINDVNLPKTGGIIVAANHPLGGLDGMAMVKTVGDIRPKVRFFVNDVLKNLKNYGDIFVGVNKVGNTSTGSLRIMENVLLSDDVIVFFPAGLVSRKQNGKIKDLDWKKSFVTQAIDHNRQIVPVFVEGENSKFFYRFANWRKAFGIKANLEMLLLPDELFRQRGKTVKIHFGKPFEASLLHSGKSHRTWAQIIKEYIYSDEFKKGKPFEDYLKNNSF